jgi:biotin carboxyl carrier protein
VVRVDDASYAVRAPEALSPQWQTVAVEGATLRLRADVAVDHVRCAFADADLALDIRPLHAANGGSAAARHGVVRAPMMGVVVAVNVQSGQAVAAGDRLATLESMKMELAIAAPVAGRVAWIGCAPQGKVERHQELFRIETD